MSRTTLARTMLVRTMSVRTFIPTFVRTLRALTRRGTLLILPLALIAGSGRAGEFPTAADVSGIIQIAAKTSETAADTTGSEGATADKTPSDAAALRAAAPPDALEALIRRAVDVTSRRYLSTEVHTPWQIAHGVCALRHHYYLKNAQGEKVKALDWIADDPHFDGKPWFVMTRFGGKGQPFTEPYHFEGHPNQFLALFTLAQLPRDFTFKAGERTFTIADWIHTAKMESNNHEEMTWTLWSLAFYLEPDAEWYNAQGEHWSMERLIRKQIATPITRSACGGNHGLFAVACARNSYLQAGHPLRGAWLEGHMWLQQYVELAKRWQNPDGSFSSEWYKSPAHSDDVNRRLTTTGHCLEFLMVALPQDEINKPWVRRAVERICRDLIDPRGAPVDGKAVGGMYHSVNALMLYSERMGWQTAPKPPQDAGPQPSEPEPQPVPEVAEGEVDTEIR